MTGIERLNNSIHNLGEATERAAIEIWVLAGALEQIEPEDEDWPEEISA